MPKPLRLALLLCLTLLTGCISNDDYSKAVASFHDSSAKLTSGFQDLLTSANLAEENAFIDAQVFEAGPIDPASIASHDLLTPDQIKLRLAAIKALTDYTEALATLASGKPAAAITADTDKASDSLKSLTADVTAAASSTTTDYATPISAAVSAIGDVISLIERHRGENDVRESLRKNDPALAALFNLLSKESASLFARRQATLSNSGNLLFHDYAVAAAHVPPNSAELLQLSDRIKQYQQNQTLIAASDPTKAVADFQASHDKLVATILAPKDQKQKSLAELIRALKSFASDVIPLGQNSHALANSLP